MQRTSQETLGWKKQKLESRLLGEISIASDIGDQWRNNSRKNEGMEPKQKQYPAVDVLVIEAMSDTVKSNIA